MVSKTKLIFLLLLMPIVIDQINGFLTYEMGILFPLSQIFKAAYLVFFVVYIGIYERKHTDLIYILLLVFIMLMPIAVANIWLMSKWANPQVDFGFAAKLLMLPISFLFFKQLFLQYPLMLEKLPSRFAFTLLTILFLALVLSLFGFGESQYGITEDGVSLAFKGYFTAGNELGALYVLLYSICLFYALSSKRTFLTTSVTIVMAFLIMLLTMTKTAIISFAVITFGIPILMTIYEQKYIFLVPAFYFRKMSVIFLVTGISMVVVGWVFIADRVMLNIDRWSDNLNKVDGNISNFIVSGRTERYGPALDHYIHEYGILEWLFGAGWQHFQYAVTNDGVAYSVEMDFIDILLENGIIGVTAVYLVWCLFWVFTAHAFFKKRNFMVVPIFLAVSLLLMNSFLSGHILYSALLNFHLAFFMAAVLFKQENMKILVPVQKQKILSV